MPAATSDVLDDVCDVLRQHTYGYRDEIELHQGMSQAFTDAGIPHSREVAVTGGRIDFLIGNLGIEVKIQGQSAAVQRQLARYARDPRIECLLLVTTRRVHRSIAREAHGTPIHVLSIGGFGL